MAEGVVLVGYRKKQTAERLSESLAEVQRLIALHHEDDAVAPANSPALDELQQRLQNLHPADIAYILEALPLDERLLVWDRVKAQQDGDILLEVSDAVRETLIESMAPDELLAAARQLDTDELADLAGDLPRQVVYEVMGELDEAEREQLQSACPIRRAASAR
jgi:magnesium transporter